MGHLNEQTKPKPKSNARQRMQRSRPVEFFKNNKNTKLNIRWLGKSVILIVFEVEIYNFKIDLEKNN